MSLRPNERMEVAVDAEEGRQRREDNMVEIRKSKREENLLKKRRGGMKSQAFPQSIQASAAVKKVKFQLESLPAMVAGVYSEYGSLQLEATTQVIFLFFMYDMKAIWGRRRSRGQPRVEPVGGRHVLRGARVSAGDWGYAPPPQEEWIDGQVCSAHLSFGSLVPIRGRYDTEAIYFDDGVRTAKRQQLESKLM